MNHSPRQLELVQEVRRLRSVSVEALAERFGVTLQTVRREVVALAQHDRGAATGEIARDAGAVDAAADHQHVARRRRRGSGG